MGGRNENLSTETVPGELVEGYSQAHPGRLVSETFPPRSLVYFGMPLHVIVKEIEVPSCSKSRKQRLLVRSARLFPYEFRHQVSRQSCAKAPMQARGGVAIHGKVGGALHRVKKV